MPRGNLFLAREWLAVKDKEWEYIVLQPRIEIGLNVGLYPCEAAHGGQKRL